MISNLKIKAKKIIKEKKNNTIYLVAFIFLIVGAFVPQTTVDITDGLENMKVNFNILHFFVVPMFELSLIICCFKLIYKENIGDDDIVSGFKNYSKVLGASLLVALYTALWSLLIIPIFIKPFSYSMTLRIIKDNPDIKVNEAITKSRELMDGHKVELFLLILSFIGWFILSILTLGILFIWVLPYMQTTINLFYLKISGKDIDNLKGEEPNIFDTKYNENVSKLNDKNLSNREKKCPLCGKLNPKANSYCEVCGEKLDSDIFS